MQIFKILHISFLALGSFHTLGSASWVGSAWVQLGFSVVQLGFRCTRWTLFTLGLWTLWYKYTLCYKWIHISSFHIKEIRCTKLNFKILIKLSYRFFHQFEISCERQKMSFQSNHNIKFIPWLPPFGSTLSTTVVCVLWRQRPTICTGRAQQLRDISDHHLQAAVWARTSVNQQLRYLGDWRQLLSPARVCDD